jgi:hypothetical protein
MAIIVKEILTKADPAQAWDAIRDVGALHTRLVRGFVTNTELVPGGRRVTFANGAIVEEPIVGTDDQRRRLVWTAKGGSLPLTHYNSAVQVFTREEGGSRIVWTSDILPEEAAAAVEQLMDQGARAMASTLDAGL